MKETYMPKFSSTRQHQVIRFSSQINIHDKFRNTDQVHELIIT